MTNQIAYFKTILQLSPKSEMMAKIHDMPLKKSDIDFLTDCVEQLSYEEMMSKYNMSKDGVYKRKIRVVERFMKLWLKSS